MHRCGMGCGRTHQRRPPAADRALIIGPPTYRALAPEAGAKVAVAAGITASVGSVLPQRGAP